MGRIVSFVSAIALTVGLAAPSLAQVCGNGNVEPGEDCDLGSGINGAPTFCCDATCHFRPNHASCDPTPGDCSPLECDGGINCVQKPPLANGSACLVPGFDPCHQGTCSGGVCQFSGGEQIDPCVNTCAVCTVVAPGTSPSNYSCGPTFQPAGTPCSLTGAPYNDICIHTCDGSGFCTNSPVICPTHTDECKRNVCRTPSGACREDNQPNDKPCTPDNDQCTVDHCNGNGACVHNAGNRITDGQACDDGDTCTTGDQCNNGSCQSFGPPQASGTACNINSCKSGMTCSGSPIKCRGGSNKADTALCDDGNFCTVNDHCHNGNCISGGNKANNTACDDQNGCTAGETCQSGQCTNPTSFVAAGGACGDGNPCTTGNGTCSTGHVCQYNPVTQTTPDGTPCVDDFECAPGTCRTGACTFRVPKDPNAACDSNSCTNAHCNEQLACVFDATPCQPSSTVCDVCPAAACKNNPNQVNANGTPVPCGCFDSIE